MILVDQVILFDQVVLDYQVILVVQMIRMILVDLVVDLVDEPALSNLASLQNIHQFQPEL